MRHLYIVVLFMCNASIAQEVTSDTTKLDEIVISANRVPERRSDVAQQISLIKKEYILQQSPMNIADLLVSTGDVFVQKSQQGGGSPVLRGFEASRVLLVVDGVRLNNIIYRAGHLQNSITLDPSVLERVEILNGSGSTIYGSDALGGVIHFKTRNPMLSWEGLKTNIFGSVSSSYHSVHSGGNINGTLNVGWKKIGLFSGITLSRFGDLKMGGSPNPFYDKGYFGERLFYADRINGVDVLVPNDNKLVQKFSGYDQIDLIQKVIYKPSESVEHSINIQYSNSTNVPRYDRLTDPKGSGLNSAEWYYGPQKRFLAIYNMGYTMDGFFKNIDINANYQSVRESRHNRNFGSAALNHRIEDVTVVGLQISGVHKHERHDLRLGVDSYWNGVQSTASKENITNGVISPLNTRYPDGGNQQWTTSAYASHTMKINESFTLNDGVRLGYNALSSNFKDKSFFPFPFDQVGQNNFIYSANAGLIYQMTKGVRLSYLCALGFRTPNIDDLSKVFDSTPGIVIVPNPNLKPESTVSNEINIGYFDKSWSVENVIYYTHLSNFISLAPGTFNGQPQILYNDSLSAVYTSVNQARGYIYGFNSNIRKKLSHHMSVFGSLSYTYGRNKNGDQVSPLDHVAPLFGKIGMQYSDARLDGSFFVLYNGKKDIKDYSLSGEDNAQYAPLTGMPAWMTFNIRVGYNVSKVLKLQLGVENILDTQYRYFASGINAAGRNFWTTLRVSF